MLMRINILAKKINSVLLFLLFFAGTFVSTAQCPTILNTNQTFCNSQNPTIASLTYVDNGGGIKWYATATAPAAAFINPSTSILSSATFYADDATGACGTRQAVTVTIYNPPTGPSGQTVCVDNLNNATIADLSLTGNNVQWYTTATGGTPLTTSTILIDNTPYYASQTNPITGCETTRTLVAVRVKLKPLEPTGNALQQFCNDPSNPPTVADLVASSNLWYSVPTNGIQLSPTTQLVDGQTYYCEAYEIPCSSETRLAVTVSLTEPNNAGFDGEIHICENQITSTAPFNLFDELNGSPENSGTWTGPVVTTNGFLGTLNVAGLTAASSPYVFTYTVGNGACPFNDATVNVIIEPTPSATISLSSTTICTGNLITVSFLGTPNATVTYSENGIIKTIVLDSNGLASFPHIYTTTTIFNLISIASSGVLSCVAPLNQTTTLTVLPLPEVTISQNTRVCYGGSVTTTISGTPNTFVNYMVNGQNQSVVIGPTGQVTFTNNYTATTIINLVNAATLGTPSCSKDLTGSIIIEVVPDLVASVSSNTPICSGNTGIISFTGTPNATVIYTLNGGSNQTIVLNALGVASLNQLFSSTTVITLVSVSITVGTTFCQKNLSDIITLEVVQLPTAVILPIATNPICSGDTATINLSGTPNATVFFAINGVDLSVVLDSNGLASYSTNLTINSTVSLVSAITGGATLCSQTLSQTEQITVIPTPFASISISTNNPICAGGNATVVFTGTPNATVTYYIDNNPNQTLTIEPDGTTEISGNYTQTTVFTLVSVSSGSISCVNNVTGSVTINVIQIPVASVSASVGSNPVCAGQDVVLTFTGTPNAIVTYQVNSGNNQIIQLGATGTLEIHVNYSITTTISMVSVVVPGNTPCSQLLSQTITINVIPLPQVVVSLLNTDPICVGGNKTIVFTGTPGATVVYHVGTNPNQTLVIEPDGTTEIVVSLTQTTIVTLVSITSATTPICEKLLTTSITINVIDLPTATISISSNLVCFGETAVVTFTGTPNATVNYLVNGNSQSIVLNNLGTNSISSTYTTTTIYTLVSVVTSGITPCSSLLSGNYTITVKQLPFATITGTATVCYGETALVTINGTPNATVVYSSNGTNHTIVLNNLGVFTFSDSYTTTTTISLISVTSNDAPSCTKLLNNAIVTIIVSQQAIAGTSTSIEVCSDDGIQNLFLLLGATAQTGGVWTNPNGSIGTGFFNSLIDSSGVYTYTVAGISPCPNSVATITVLKINKPNAGTGGSHILCTNTDPIDLFTLLGGNPQVGGTWSPALASNTGVFNPAVDITGNYTYTVSGVGPCQDASAVLIINVVDGPNAGISNVAPFCSNSSPQSLFTFLGGNPDVGGTWTPSLSGGIFNPATNTPGLYTYSFSGTGSCSNDTATVLVTVNPVPSAGEDGTAFFCTNYAPADLFSYLQGTPQTGGTWTPTLASNSGVFNPMVDLQGVYTYTIGGGLCAEDTATVTVSVVQSPNAGGLNASLLVKACTTTTNVDLFTGLNGNQGVGVWTNSNNVIVSNIINPSFLTVGNHQFTYTVSGGVSPCSTDSAVVTLEIDPIPNAGTFNPITPICNSGGTINLFTLLSGNQLGGIWKDAFGQTVNSSIDYSAFAAGTYNFTYTISNECGVDTEAVHFILLSNPVLAIPDITVVSPYCLGENLAVNLINMIDGNYTITYLLSGSNSTSNQIATINVIAGSSSFVIDSALIPNVGNTTITFLNIVNTITNCTSSLSNIFKEITISPIPDIVDANISISTVCFGNDVVVAIAGATSLSDGDYQFNYTIPTAIPSIGVSAVTSIVAGAGSFVIPAASLPNFGTYVLNVTGVLNSITGCSNLSESVTSNFTVLEAPNITGANVTVANDPICINSSNIVSITNALSLNGSYTLTYELTGANSIITTIPINFTSGSGSFEIPKSVLSVAGSITVTILSLVNQTTLCGLNGASFPAVSFDVYGLATPNIENKGNQFCGKDLPTIEDLSANIAENQPVLWYDAAILGNVYAPTDLLQDGATYYATFSIAGCESTPRLQVTVDLSFCNELLIPDGFSPNSDTVNDSFVIENLREQFPNYKLEIYNRYGNVLYSGDIRTPDWDGTTSANGLTIGKESVPVGVYFYVLELNSELKKPIQGRIYLSR